VKLAEDEERGEQQDDRKRDRKESGYGDQRVAPEVESPRPGLAQVPEVIVHHLHQEQAAREQEHDSEDREPFAQEVPVKRVQRRDRTTPAPLNQILRQFG
jgi:hypothetical protein